MTSRTQTIVDFDGPRSPNTSRTTVPAPVGAGPRPRPRDAEQIADSAAQPQEALSVTRAWVEGGAKKSALELNELRHAAHDLRTAARNALERDGVHARAILRKELRRMAKLLGLTSPEQVTPPLR